MFQYKNWTAFGSHKCQVHEFDLKVIYLKRPVQYPKFSYLGLFKLDLRGKVSVLEHNRLISLICDHKFLLPTTTIARIRIFNLT